MKLELGLYYVKPIHTTNLNSISQKTTENSAENLNLSKWQ